MKKILKFLRFSPVFLFFGVNSLFGLGPAAAVSVPLVGGFLGTKSSNAKGLLREADKAIFCLKLLFLIVAAVFMLISILWSIRFIYKSVKYKRFVSLANLLSRLPA